MSFIIAQFSLFGYLFLCGVSLENRKGGVYAYCSLNETESGQTAKNLIQHGDVTALSIYANQLQQRGGDVLHGEIREVSLVLAGANPGAYIESVLQHGEESDEEAVIYSGENLTLYHSDEGESKVADESKKRQNDDSGETVQDVFDTLTEKQKTVVYAIIGQALNDKGKGSNEDEEDDDEGGKTVKHNVFDTDTGAPQTYLSHADMQRILGDAKRCGSLRDAVYSGIENGVLSHAAIDTTGMTVATGNLWLQRPVHAVPGLQVIEQSAGVALPRHGLGQESPECRSSHTL